MSIFNMVVPIHMNGMCMYVLYNSRILFHSRLPPPFLVLTGNAVFVPHALLLRGSMYSLYRQDPKALKDLQDVINTKDLPNEVKTTTVFVFCETVSVAVFLHSL